MSKTFPMYFRNSYKSTPMSELPFISVIIPVRNGERYIAEALESIHAQQYEGKIEVIVVDDGSTDRSVEQARAGSRGLALTVIRLPASGVATARNAGVRAAQGEIIAFLDADDLWPPFKLQSQLACFRLHPGIETVLGLSVFGEPLANGRGFKANPLERIRFCFHLGSGLYRRSLFQTAGFFDASLEYAEDIEWFMRVREQNALRYLLNQPGLLWRKHEANMTRDKGFKELHILRSLKKSIDRGGTPAHETLFGTPGFSQPLQGDAAREASLVSVILPVYNGASLAADAVRSVLNQTHRHLELLVVDDGSTDGTTEILKKNFSDHRIRFITRPNGGVAAARNTGLNTALGEWIAFIDQDDLWTADKLQIQLEASRRLNADFILAWEKMFLDSSCTKPGWLKEDLLAQAHESFVPGAWLIRRRIFNHTSFFKEDYVTGSDSEWYLRAKDLGVKTAMIPLPLLMRRIHAENASHQQKVIKTDLARALRDSILRKKNLPPEISIIIPVYNGEKYLAETLQSILSQTFSSYEIIIVDDGSTDGTRSVLRNFEPKIRFFSQAHAGISAARNRGLAEARGKWIAFLDADDLFMPEKLERQRRAFQTIPDLDLCMTGVEQFLSPDIAANRSLPFPAPVLPGCLPSTVMVSRAALDRVGGFDTACTVAEFMNWYLRALEIKLKIHTLPEVLVRRRIHQTNHVARRADLVPAEYLRELKASMLRRKNQENPSPR